LQPWLEKEGFEEVNGVTIEPKKATKRQRKKAAKGNGKGNEPQKL